MRAGGSEGVGHGIARQRDRGAAMGVTIFSGLWPRENGGALSSLEALPRSRHTGET